LSIDLEQEKYTPSIELVFEVAECLACLWKKYCNLAVIIKVNKLEDWRKQLHIDLIPVLLSSPNAAIRYFVKRDLLEDKMPPVDFIWGLPGPLKIIGKQCSNGSWEYKGNKIVVYPPYHYSLLETFKQFRFLVGKYQMDKKHPSISNAAEYLFSCQTADGDIRGFIGNQYATYYTGAILSLLIQAGYEEDRRIEKGIQWLLSMRQDDGGWTIPILTYKLSRITIYNITTGFSEPIEPDRTKPFSHNWTNMVLQAFAAHPVYRSSKEARIAGELLKSRFFKPDVYSSYKSADYWIRFLYWWPNLLTALQSLLLIGFSREDIEIRKAINWFIEHQENNGLWQLSYGGKRVASTCKNEEEEQWLGLAICRILKHYLT
jgi:hypothetical protein